MAVPYTKVTDLHTNIATWFEQNIVQSRTTGDKTRQWCVEAVFYKDVMLQANLRKAVDTKTLNDVYVTAYKSTNPSDKKDFVLTKIQISLLYSFLKCFVARHKTRIMCYRDDLSQKGARNMCAVSLSQDYFNDLSNLLQGKS